MPSRRYKAVSLVAAGAVTAESFVTNAGHRKPPHIDLVEQNDPRPVGQLTQVQQSTTTSDFVPPTQVNIWSTNGATLLGGQMWTFASSAWSTRST